MSQKEEEEKIAEKSNDNSQQDSLVKPKTKKSKHTSRRKSEPHRKRKNEEIPSEKTESHEPQKRVRQLLMTGFIGGQTPEKRWELVMKEVDVLSHDAGPDDKHTYRRIFLETEEDVVRSEPVVKRDKEYKYIPEEDMESDYDILLDSNGLVVDNSGRSDAEKERIELEKDNDFVVSDDDVEYLSESSSDEEDYKSENKDDRFASNRRVMENVNEVADNISLISGKCLSPILALLREKGVDSETCKYVDNAIKKYDSRILEWCRLLMERYERSKSKCFKCKTGDCDILFLPCRHVISCSTCHLPGDFTGDEKCHSCEEPITKKMKVFTNE